MPRRWAPVDAFISSAAMAPLSSSSSLTNSKPWPRTNSTKNSTPRPWPWARSFSCAAASTCIASRRSNSFCQRPVKNEPKLDLVDHLLQLKSIEIPERKHFCPPRELGVRPKDIQQIGQELAIKWEDGSESFVPLEKLRR